MSLASTFTVATSLTMQPILSFVFSNKCLNSVVLPAKHCAVVYHVSRRRVVVARKVINRPAPRNPLSIVTGTTSCCSACAMSDCFPSQRECSCIDCADEDQSREISTADARGGVCWPGFLFNLSSLHRWIGCLMIRQLPSEWNE